MRLSRTLLAITALGLTAPQLASAHTALVASTPTANASVAAPTKVELRFNEAVIGATARAEIAMTGMPGMGSHAPMPITGFTAQIGKDRKSMTLLLRRPLSAGTYQVTWTAAGADTHRMSGNFSFTVR
ncbi:copper homeostasis periplasmic binding protein CopC [Novosphingobium cyanobacteriorum]|uniref:Copper homeostasis periplasmic binding protein CopC n=1 Tax=Novosphingobium cyanobacteriorum TaxID=3024215 RepID=A0ABT6CNJ9_9SPHN|nr:copper homeostasis periplasmic binding protein CopC [Novosphingobium cyanobacteriorum]MDF8335480.1 copper homeostasis periplasmic binding protein CopC [Novosphingobium cyanobacteriorum]